MINIEICIKYFEFLTTECERYLKDKVIEENEITQLQIELNKFIEESENSELAPKIKEKIGSLKLDFAFRPHEEKMELLRGIFNIGYYRRRRKLILAVEDFKTQINELQKNIKLSEAYFE